MAKQTINIGSGELAGDGESLRSAFDKINDNFDEVYTGSTTTLGSDTTPALGGNLDLSGNDITGIGNLNITGNITATGSISASLAYSNLTSTPTTLAGYGITDAYTQTQVDTAITNATSSIVIQSGSTQSIDVVAQDSTVLVDSVNGTLNATTLTGALPAINGSALTNVTTTFANITSTPTTLAGYGITDGLQLGTSATTALAGNTALFSGAFADLTGKPTTIAGYGITDTLSSAADDITVGDAAVTIATSTGDITIDAQGSDTDIIFKGTDDASDITALTLDMSEAGKAIFNSDVAIGTSPGHYIDITKASTTIASNNNNLKLTGNGAYGVELQYGGATKLFAGNTGIEVNGDIELGVGGAKLTNNTSDLVIEPAGGKNLNINNNSGTTVFSVLSNVIQMTGGIQIKQGVEETFATLTGSTGVVEHDCNNGQVFYHTGAAGDITANFTNLNSTQEHTTNLIVIINQGATPYEVTAVQIAGAAQTINWQGGSQPTGNANGIDSFSFTILNDGGTYVVLGQMVDFT